MFGAASGFHSTDKTEVMRVLLLLFIVFLSGCNQGPSKPDNLLPEDTMIDIFYDLALLDAIRSHSPLALETQNLTAGDYIYKKYAIDSVQFALSNQYYAADISKYKQMYERVGERIEQNKAKTDTLLKKESGNLEVIDNVQGRDSEGIVR